MVGVFAAAWIGYYLGGFIKDHPSILLAPWALFLIAVFWLSRDPDPVVPTDMNAIVAPAHGKVDVIEDAMENEFIKGPSKRLSIRVSLLDPQVQFAPLTGATDHFVHQKHMKDGGTSMIENLFIGFTVIGRADTRAAVRLIAGTWGRRIVPWIKSNEIVERGVRIGMMRPATRVDLYLPAQVKLLVNVGDDVAGGQSVVAKFE
jgi:phosphatidylserine decarboxylase